MRRHELRQFLIDDAIRRAREVEEAEYRRSIGANSDSSATEDAGVPREDPEDGADHSSESTESSRMRDVSHMADRATSSESSSSSNRTATPPVIREMRHAVRYYLLRAYARAMNV